MQSSVLFWRDIWYQSCSLASRFPHLFEICTNPDIQIQEVIGSQGQSICFRRNLTDIQYREWLEILSIISQVSFTHATDQLSWRWDSSGKCTVRSLYKLLNYRGKIPLNPYYGGPFPHP